MSNLEATILELFKALVQAHPTLAAPFEKISALAQGKGFGAETPREEVQVVLKLLGHSPKLAVDIGGNVGHYTAELRRLNPALEIHVFEPAAINVERLRSRFHGDPNIFVVPRAVADASSSATLFSNVSGSGLASLSKRRLEHFSIDFDATETVQTLRFEDYWQSVLAERELDLVKLDIEGHELSALRGFGKAVVHAKVIQFEFGGCNIDTRTFFQDFWYFFTDRQFDLFRISPSGAERIDCYRESDEYFSTTNYVAVAHRLCGKEEGGI
jgi:FkbM family methyltransferase